MLKEIKNFFTKASRTGSLIMGHGSAVWSKRNPAAFAREGYQKNVIAYQAIKKVSDAAATIPRIAKAPNGDELDDHPFLRLLARPNPGQSGVELIRNAVGFYMISGNAYLERVMVGRQPREIYTLRPDRMGIKPSSTGLPSGYEFRGPTGGKVTWDADPLTGVSDIRHLKTFNPLDDWHGMSPLEAGAMSVDQHNTALEYMQALLQNGASPSGALEVEKKLTDDHYARLKADIEEKFAGARNAGRPMLLEGGMKWTQMGISPADAEIIATKYSAARDVSLALGVPPLLLNIPGDSTYNNYREARLALYEETVIPLAVYILDELNFWLSPLFGGVRLEYDFDKIPAIAEKRQELWKMVDQSEDLTINERREVKGYDSVPGGNTIYISAGKIPLDFDAPGAGGDPGAEGAAAYGDADR